MNMLNKFKNLDKYAKLSIIIILIGVILRFYLASMHHVAGDACWQLSNSRFIAENLKLPLFEHFGRDEPFWAPPFFHIVSAAVYFVFSKFEANSAEFAMKLISPLLGSLTLILLFLISRKLFNVKTAFFSVIFLAFVPLHIDYSTFSYIDGMLAFLAVLSVYFALENKTACSAAALGLAILTKYNGIFILPALLYIIYKDNPDKKNQMLKKFLILFIISAAIGSIWFIRNWIYLGNPVWPFMNSIFHGYKVESFAKSAVGSVNLLNIFNFKAAQSVYLGIFGVPDGNIKTLNFYNIPYLSILFTAWLIATIIFMVPLFLGLAPKKLKHRSLLLIWIGSYIVLGLLYVINASWAITRFLLPAFPALAMIWGHGFDKIKPANIKKILILVIVMIIAGFIFTSLIKISLAAKSWNSYNDDFEWVNSNTAKNVIFLTGSQCISYDIGRQTISPSLSNLYAADYAFVNQDFRLDRLALFDGAVLSAIKGNGRIVYSSEKTKTAIYKLQGK